MYVTLPRLLLFLDVFGYNRIYVIHRSVNYEYNLHSWDFPVDFSVFSSPTPPWEHGLGLQIPQCETGDGSKSAISQFFYAHIFKLQYIYINTYTYLSVLCTGPG